MQRARLHGAASASCYPRPAVGEPKDYEMPRSRRRFWYAPAAASWWPPRLQLPSTSPLRTRAQAVKKHPCQHTALHPMPEAAPVERQPLASVEQEMTSRVGHENHSCCDACASVAVSPHEAAAARDEMTSVLLHHLAHCRCYCSSTHQVALVECASEICLQRTRRLGQLHVPSRCTRRTAPPTARRALLLQESRLLLRRRLHRARQP